jgi:hypothetical protein
LVIAELTTIDGADVCGACMGAGVTTTEGPDACAPYEVDACTVEG